MTLSDKIHKIILFGGPSDAKVTPMGINGVNTSLYDEVIVVPKDKHLTDDDYVEILA